MQNNRISEFFEDDVTLFCNKPITAFDNCKFKATPRGVKLPDSNPRYRPSRSDNDYPKNFND